VRHVDNGDIERAKIRPRVARQRARILGGVGELLRLVTLAASSAAVIVMRCMV